jgi:hypothetical protein
MRGALMSVILSVLSCVAIAGPSPSASVPAPVLVQLQSRLRVLLERYHPGVRLERSCRTHGAAWSELGRHPDQ